MSESEPEQDEQTEPEPETDEPGVSDDEAAEAEDAEPVEPEPEPEPEARSETDIEMEKRAAAGEKKSRSNEKALRSIFDAESEYLFRCPLCPDQHAGLIDIRFAGMLPDENAEAVLSYVRGAEQVRYKQASNVSECPSCDGNGKVLSGSKVAGKDLIVCVSCKGFGFVPPPGTTENGRVEPALVPVGVGADEGPLENADVDIWGSPHYLADGQENSNYGKMPQYKDPRLP
jgi:hypothetical protein